MEEQNQEAQNSENQPAEQQVTEQPVESKKRKIVVPGEVIVTGEDFLPSDGARRVKDDIVASRYGLAEESGRVIKVISITGAYIPRRNNVVIGRVTEITGRGWVVDIDAASNAFVPLDEVPRFINRNEMNTFLDVGDTVAAKIWGITGRGIDLELRGNGLGRLEEGFTFHISPNTVPRVIGREGSMVGLIKEKTQCNITIGQNGWVWIKGKNTDNELKARKIIEFISAEVSMSGLTDKVEEMLS
jgi:exosome complex component RRP4